MTAPTRSRASDKDKERENPHFAGPHRASYGKNYLDNSTGLAEKQQNPMNQHDQIQLGITAAVTLIWLVCVIVCLRVGPARFVVRDDIPVIKNLVQIRSR